MAVSPLHVKDTNPDGTKKPLHYHLLLNYKGIKPLSK
ncbi:MAG: Rep family protein [Liquorilactobacillus hordei]